MNKLCHNDVWVAGGRATYFVGLDLGQRRDHTAIAVVERREMWRALIDPVTYEHPRRTRYGLRYLERVALGTPYGEIVARVGKLVRSAELSRHAVLVVDATGVGAPVLERLREAQLGCAIVGVLITGGEREHYGDGMFRVPKRDLVSGVQTMLEGRELRIAARIADAPALVEELMAMRVTVLGSGRERYGARGEGAHDDMVLALALACWRARRGEVGEGRRSLGLE